jgi:MinD-like ATPase involved in chromosome partitioning or flagellar assembly
MVDPTFGLYFSVIQTLERLDVPYVIIGAFAGMSYGVTRLTADMDIVVNLAEGHIQALAAAYPPLRYYADP